MSACCYQCLNYALRAKFAGTSTMDANGEAFEPLSSRERQEWGRGHFLCSEPTESEMRAYLAGEISPLLDNNSWRWV